MKSKGSLQALPYKPVLSYPLRSAQVPMLPSAHHRGQGALLPSCFQEAPVHLPPHLDKVLDLYLNHRRIMRKLRCNLGGKIKRHRKEA